MNTDLLVDLIVLSSRHDGFSDPVDAISKKNIAAVQFLATSLKISENLVSSIYKVITAQDI